MFASRLPERIDPSPLARLIAEARRSGAELLDLTESNPTRAGFVYPEREILSSFGDPRSLVYDPEPRGLPEARALIARMAGVAENRVLLTASTSEAYSWLFKFLCNPGDEILVPSPSYPLFAILAALESVTVRHYPLRYYRGWFTDTHALKSLITKRTRAIVVVNPNNPTGSYLKRHEQWEIAVLCGNCGLAFISDEVFADYSLVEDPERAKSITLARGPLAFSLNGLSKLAGMPQMKLGWMIITGQPPWAETARERLEIIADTYLSVSTPVQYALPALLAARETIQPQIMERLRDNLAWLREQVTGSYASLLQVEGGWSAILRVPQIRTEEQWVTMLLRDHRVLVQPGYFYDFDSEAFLVLSLLTRTGDFREGISRLLSCVAR